MENISSYSQSTTSSTKLPPFPRDKGHTQSLQEMLPAIQITKLCGIEPLDCTERDILEAGKMGATAVDRR